MPLQNKILIKEERDTSVESQYNRKNMRDTIEDKLSIKEIITFARNNMLKDKELSNYLTWRFSHGDGGISFDDDNNDETLAREPTNRLVTELIQFLSDSCIIDELKRRYWYKQKKGRLEILHFMLDFNEETRQWAYKKLLQHWYDECIDVLCQLWEKYNEKECACLVMAHAPLEYVKSHAEDLGNYDYASLCLRLGHCPNFQIEKKRLHPCEYMYIATKLRLDVSKEECELYLYLTTADCLKKVNPNKDRAFAAIEFESLTEDSWNRIGMITTYLQKNKSKEQIYWDYRNLSNRINEELTRRLRRDMPFQCVEPKVMTQYFIEIAYEFFPEKYMWMLQDNEWPSIEECPF